MIKYIYLYSCVKEGILFVFLSVKGGVLISFQTSRERWRRSPQETPCWTASTTSWCTQPLCLVYLSMIKCISLYLSGKGDVFISLFICRGGCIYSSVQGGVFISFASFPDRWRRSPQETPCWTALTTSWWKRLLYQVHLSLIKCIYP